MLAMDEYGTRRVKQWMNHCIEPALRQLGKIVLQYSQALYTGHKVFRIVQPSSLQEGKEVQINVPMYNDMGEAVGKWRDYAAAKMDIRIVAGSTLPLNRWAYLEELKELMKLNVVDDIAVLAETDIRNKDKIAQRKSLYAQQQGQIQELDSAVKDGEGTIETLERQLVQAGVKMKIMQAEMEVEKAKHDQITAVKKSTLETQAQQKNLRNTSKNSADAATQSRKQQDEVRRKQLDMEAQDAGRNLYADYAEAGRNAKANSAEADRNYKAGADQALNQLKADYAEAGRKKKAEKSE
jgi:hypothetical protein